MSTLSSTQKILLGTSVWLAEKTGMDIQMIRIFFIIFVLIGGSGILLYLLLWLISQVVK